ncbi:MAG: PASTA domain-containing protein [Deltaproteobacteria bacterium]|nr:PASTA domain-containing protein [Deltaproteobacteria bacterium]
MSIFSRDRVFWIRFRVVFIMLFVAAGFIAVGHGAWNLGVTRHDELTGIAKAQYTRRIHLSARRGLITDRYGEELAVEVEVDSVYADPREVENPGKDAIIIAKILGQDVGIIQKRLSSPRHFVWLKRQVSPTESKLIKKENIKGIHTIKESKRFYPGRRLAAQVIGFAGIDSKGLEGLERLYDEELRGNQDAASGLADAGGNIIFTKGAFGENRLVGNNISLTIDQNLQYDVEEELENVVRLFQAKSGEITVMDPNTGEVLAMASWPTFNLNHIGRSTSAKRRNRPVLDVFEPGSTMKVFTLAAALNSGAIRPDEETYCERGRMEFYDVVLHDDHRDGWLNPRMCLKRSSNICFAKIAARMGAKKLHDYLKRFGFGEKTGVQVPYESKGLLQHFDRWNEFLTATVAFGQGIGVTGIQMATALSAIANGGVLLKPSLVKKISDAEGNIIYEFHKEERRRVLSRRTARLVADMMTSVTEEGGTGTEAAMEGYLVAGKTGTAQKSSGSKGYKDSEKFVASFFGFIPADKPRLVISVVIDEPLVSYFGGTVSAPVFKRIASKAMRDMGISPDFATVKKRRQEAAKEVPEELDEDLDEEDPDLNSDVVKALQMITPYDLPLQKGEVRVPDLKGATMNTVLKKIEKSKLRPLFMGTGISTEQIPPPGQPVKEGSYVQVNFTPLGDKE